MGFNLNIPLKLTRNWTYFVTSVFTTFVILLPLSILIYLKFYDTLIPQPSPAIPFQLHGSGTVDLVKLKSHYQFDLLLDYNVIFNLKGYCDLNSRILMPYQILAHSDRGQNKATNYTALIDCSRHPLYSLNNWFVPYNLRLWVPPILVDYSQYTSITLDKLVLNGDYIQKHLHSVSLLSPYGKSVASTSLSFLIDDDYSFVQFQINFSGFRYYMVKHFYTCLLAGVLIFWTISSLVCLVVSYAMLLEKKQDKREPKRT